MQLRNYFFFTEYFVGDFSKASLQSWQQKATTPSFVLVRKIRRMALLLTGQTSLIGISARAVRLMAKTQVRREISVFMESVGSVACLH